jgi:hypothetical protein
MITPARIPLTHGRVRASVLYPLSPAYGPIVDREVDGDARGPCYSFRGLCVRQRCGKMAPLV